VCSVRFFCRPLRTEIVALPRSYCSNGTRRWVHPLTSFSLRNSDGTNLSVFVLSSFDGGKASASSQLSAVPLKCSSPLRGQSSHCQVPTCLSPRPGLVTAVLFAQRPLAPYFFATGLLLLVRNPPGISLGSYAPGTPKFFSLLKLSSFPPTASDSESLVCPR